MHSINDIVKDIRNGKMVIIMDDEDRENEGDLLIAASKVGAEDINFMAGGLSSPLHSTHSNTGKKKPWPNI